MRPVSRSRQGENVWAGRGAAKEWEMETCTCLKVYGEKKLELFGVRKERGWG